ncbi:MAG: hypothetical protein CVT47_03285 [Thermoplasmata archaeon HGW-Thermoplasmata-2]|nr:MAG: hypothetical protein CVT47_03285 [Thermoplasmata archaeon HGW-Thermoplasmata-2]
MSGRLSIRFAWDEIKDHKQIYLTVVVVIGLTMGAFMLQNGYHLYMMQVINDSIRETLTGDVMVAAPDTTVRGCLGSQETMANAREIASKIEQGTGYDASVRVTCQGSYNVGRGYDGVVIQGLDLKEDILRDDLAAKVIEGEWFEPDKDYLRHHSPWSASGEMLGQNMGYSGEMPNDPPYPVVAGSALATQHGVKIDDVISITFTLSTQGTQVGQISVQIIGFYSTGLSMMDTLMWFMPDDCLREIKSYGSAAGTQFDPYLGTMYFTVDKNMGDTIIVDTREPANNLDNIGYAEKVREKVREAVGGDYSVYSWHDIVVFASGTLQDTGVMMIWGTIFVILTLAGMAIKYVMESIVMRKTREIGALKAFGARDRTVMWIFLSQGIFIGGAGGAVGIGIAALVMSIISWYGLSVGFISGTELKVGFAITPFTMMITFMLPVGVSLLAAIVPAKMAARLSPVEALRKGELAF